MSIQDIDGGHTVPLKEQSFSKLEVGVVANQMIHFRTELEAARESGARHKL